MFSMLASGFTAARFGLRASLLPALILTTLALGSAVFAPGYAFLTAVMLAAGIGEGILEGLATPFTQELHRHEDVGRYLNFTHSFWSVGVLLATIGAGLMLFWQISWQKVLMITAAAALPGIILLAIPSPLEQQRLNAKNGQSSKAVLLNAVEIFKSGRFWLFFAAIFFAGGGEWCLTFWLPSFIRIVHGGSALAASVVIALFASGMILGRMFSGVWVPQKHLPKLLIAGGSSAMVLGSCLPFVNNFSGIMVLVFLCGVAIGPFWPTIQSVCADKVKLDSTLIYILLSCAGIPGCGLFTWLQGMLGDVSWIGLRYGFLLMPFSVGIMTLMLAAAFKLRR